jgi:hypothetical protein
MNLKTEEIIAFSGFLQKGRVESSWQAQKMIPRLMK